MYLEAHQVVVVAAGPALAMHVSFTFECVATVPLTMSSAQIERQCKQRPLGAHLLDQPCQADYGIRSQRHPAWPCRSVLRPFSSAHHLKSACCKFEVALSKCKLTTGHFAALLADTTLVPLDFRLQLPEAGE